MKKLMELAQAQQVKELEASFEKENKEMKAAQAKVRMYIGVGTNRLCRDL